MEKIAIVVDSTSGLSKEDGLKNNISIIPLFFYFGEESYFDGELSQEEFFKLVDKYYSESKELPKTSQPAIGTCIDLFAELLKENDKVIYFTISSKLSGTYQSGCTAAKEFDGKVTVVDSLAASAVLAQSAIKARKLADSGKSVDEIVEITTSIMNEGSIKIVIDDLSHLQRTGRVNAAAAVIGSMLNLKPIVTLEDGLLTPTDKIRSLSKAHKIIADEVLEKGLGSKDYIAIAHANGYDAALNIEKYLRSKNSDVAIEIVELSPVVSTHTGPLSCGIITIKNLF